MKVGAKLKKRAVAADPNMADRKVKSRANKRAFIGTCLT